jgi:hypothetical protein
VILGLVLFADLYICFGMLQSFLLPIAIAFGSMAPAESNSPYTNIVGKDVLFSTFTLFCTIVFLPYLGYFRFPRGQSSISQYRYSRLSQNSDTIRLSRLLPGEGEMVNVQCELFEYTLRELSVTSYLYEALSYVWGSEADPLLITVDGQKLAVTQNLCAVLLRLRDCNIPRIIWVDAVCIDQADEKEKEHQIRLLPAIYAKANRVAVWLGKAHSNSYQVLEAIRLASIKSTDRFNVESFNKPSGTYFNDSGLSEFG